MSNTTSGLQTTDEHLRVIAIDGPAASGKSTVASVVADRLGALFFDTGALYRAVALAALRSGIAPNEAKALSIVAKKARIDIRPASVADGRLYDVLLEGEDVTWPVRSREVGEVVSQIAAHPSVRAALLPVQRDIALRRPVVMVGRDIGTIVVPDAGLKVFLDASPEERARRRYQESAIRGAGASFHEILKETHARDLVDSSRETAPLRVAPDAVKIKTDKLSAAEVAFAVESLARTITLPTGEPAWPN